MRSPIRRRDFLAASLATAATAPAFAASTADTAGRQEFYQLRVYRIADAGKQQVVSEYLEKALLPALNRVGIDRVGVFTALADPPPASADDLHSLLVLIPTADLQLVGQLPSRLAADAAFCAAAAPLWARPMKDPAYQRIESRLMKAFAGMPVIELPAETRAGKPRIFELRVYESCNNKKAALKVDMFNSGEIDIMRDVGMAPVFYGETLVSDDLPNLTYMLSASDMAAHKAHWKAFIAHPEWDRMKKMEKYKETVSKIRNWYLEPTPYSQI